MPDILDAPPVSVAVVYRFEKGSGDDVFFDVLANGHEEVEVGADVGAGLLD